MLSEFLNDNALTKLTKAMDNQPVVHMGSDAVKELTKPSDY